jgi:MFS transporter, AAHS family, 4-hydroxybenzoate transporter
VTLTIVCIPLGAMLAAYLSKRMIPAVGLRGFFLIGGMIPFVVGVLLYWVLAESPRFLASRKERWPELIALLRRMGHEIDPEATFVDVGSTQVETKRSAILELFSPEFLRDTFGLAVSFFFCLLANYLAFQLLVPTLTGIGFSHPAASGLLVWWNVGGVCGALGAALLIKWFGSRTTMLGLSLIAIASAFGLSAMRPDPANDLGLVIMCVVLGSTLNAVQTAMYALAAHVYPTRIRGTGIGTSVAVGRIGNVLASYTGNLALNLGGVAAYFATFGIAMIVVFLGLAVVRRHIERAVPRPEAALPALE